jgi:citrate lyase subunit beta/citryl-CoA lyase
VRSLLIVASGDGACALDSGADALVVDVATAAALPVRAGEPAIYLRFGGLDDASAADALAAAAALRPRGVVLSPATGGGDVQRLGARLAVEEALLGLPDGTIRVLAFATETAQAIFGLSSYRGASARLDGLMWSAAPLDAALRASPARRAAGPFALARNLTLLAARAAGALALDAPFPDVRDLDGVRAEALAAKADGFDGKAAIHPDQVAVINEVFG